MSQKLPVKSFKCVKDISKFDESFMKSYNEENHEGYFFNLFDAQYPEKLHKLHNYLPFLPESMKIRSSKSLSLICMMKLNMLFT